MRINIHAKAVGIGRVMRGGYDLAAISFDADQAIAQTLIAQTVA